MQFDPELKYCLACRDEYRAEIEKCAGCGRDLLTGHAVLSVLQGKEGERRLPELKQGDTLVTIQAGSLVDMKGLKRLLEKAAIPSAVISEKDCRQGCCGPQFMLQVRAQDTEAAGSILYAQHASTTRLYEHGPIDAEATFDQAAARVRCPACGTGFIPEGAQCPECGLHFG